MKNICIIILLINSFILNGQDSSSVIFNGRVINESTYQALRGIDVILILEKDTLRKKTDNKGCFSFNNLKPDKIYYLELKEMTEFYLYNSFLFTYSLNAKKEIFIEYKIVPYARCHAESLSEILFESNKFNLSAKNKDDLTDILLLLRANKELIINIYGYRSFEETEKVSYKRALEVKNYLISNQIEAERLFIVDNGTKPRTIYPNCIYTTIPLESQTTKLSQEYINSLRSEKDKQEAIKNQRVVTFDIRSDDYKNK